MKIAEASERYGISADTLRYYERIGLLRHVPRNASGVRDYDESGCQTIEFIKCMRDAGVSVKVLAEYMELMDQGEETIARRRELLEGQRELIADHIDELQKALDRLDYKIEHYEDVVAPREREMTSRAAQRAER